MFSEFNQLSEQLTAHINDAITLHMGRTGRRGISHQQHREVIEEFLNSHPGSREVLDSYNRRFKRLGNLLVTSEPYPTKPGKGYLSEMFEEIRRFEEEESKP